MAGLPCFALLVSFLSFVASQDYPFQDPSLPWDDRVDDLVNRLTLDEVVGQLSHGGTDPGSGPAPAIPRLGINPYGWNTECLCGDVGAGPATSFPQALGLAATFSKDVVFRMAEATAIEVRAKFNTYSANNEYGDHKGVSCFSPVINIMRHPLWGRNQETYGEDPFLTGQMSIAFVEGLQGSDPRYIRANAGCKHFDVHNGPEDKPVSRFSFDAVVSTRDWRVTFLPAFEKCVKAGSYNIMCSYNSINGVPACANSELLTDILRTEWGFKGYVISDQDAVENVLSEFHYTPDKPSTAAACLNAGCNLELSSSNPDCAYSYISDAIDQGLLTNETVYKAVWPLFYTRMRLGEFDPPSMNQYASLNESDFIQSQAHQNLALEFAMKSFVLLQNTDDFLPLKQSSFNQISVVGPMADNPEQQFGDYSPDYDPLYTTTPYTGLSVLASTTITASGCNDNYCSTYDSASVITALQGSELIFVCLGTGKQVESEGNDRADLPLPGEQNTLLDDVIANANGVPIVLLLFNCGPIQLSASQRNGVKAILELYFPGQATGVAIKNVLLNFGPYANPAGRLPNTWPVDISQVPEMTNYSMVNRTYRYWQQSPPLYPFGYGLSYTTFSYSNLVIAPTQIHVEDSVSIQVRVTNTGSIDGEEVVQVYIQWLDTLETMPFLQLVDFDRILIPAGSTYIYQAIIPPEQMAVYEDDNGFVVEPGRINVFVGGQQPNQEVSVGSNVLTGQFVIAAA